VERPRRLPDGQPGERQKDAQGKTYKERPLRFGQSHGDSTHYKPQCLLERNQEGHGVLVSFGMGWLSTRPCLANDTSTGHSLLGWETRSQQAGGRRIACGAERGH